MNKLRLFALLVVIPMAVCVLAGCIAAVVGGAGTAVLIGEDRRTVGTVTDDGVIEVKTSNRIGDKFKGSHVNVTSYNRMVLLTGEVPDASTKTEIAKIARAVENVRSVYDEIAIAGNSALSARGNDSFVTGKVKGRFLDQQKFNPVHVKVVTESGVVYLLGMVKRKEAEDATEIARTTAGARKVVKLFEYLD
ncbi:MAG TPA: BON domain-containing protein [Burkholderiales bacterium]|nr:BON domain-containing protein [Burkholderiales bacterium]